MTLSGQRFSSLSGPSCREHLAAGTVGRVAWNDRRGPQILPVTYVVHDEQIVFRTDAHGPLARLQGGEPVVFEVDSFDASTRNGWSVVVRGRAYAAQRSQRAARLWREADPVPWAGGDRTLFVMITLDELTGRQIERASWADDERRADGR